MIFGSVELLWVINRVEQPVNNTAILNDKSAHNTFIYNHTFLLKAPTKDKTVVVQIALFFQMQYIYGILRKVTI